MADDLKRFFIEERQNFHRYRSNIESIIQKYDRHFADDAEIDLTTLNIYRSKDEKKVRRLKARPFGHTKLLSKRSKELSESVGNGSFVSVDFTVCSDSSSTIQDTTIKGSPTPENSEFGQTFIQNDLSVYQDEKSITEEDSEFLALKSSYFEIISEKNDEPSDAETLSSYSSEEDTFQHDDDSEDGDDEDSQTDDRIIPTFPAVCEEYSTSLTSDDDKMEIDKARSSKVKSRIGRGNDMMLCDELDGDVPARYPNISGYSYRKQTIATLNQVYSNNGQPMKDNLNFNQNAHKESLSTNLGKTHLRYNSIEQTQKRADQITEEKKERIENWIDEINMESGMRYAEKRHFNQVQDSHISDQTFVINDQSNHMGSLEWNSRNRQSVISQDGVESKKFRHQSLSLRKESERKQPRRIVPVLLQSDEVSVSNESRPLKTVDGPFSPLPSIDSYVDTSISQDFGSYNENKFQHSNRNIAAFASPDRVLKRMKENRVGVAAKIFSSQEKQCTSSYILEEKKVDTESIGLKENRISNTSMNKSNSESEKDDIFIIEDCGNHIRPNSNKDARETPEKNIWTLKNNRMSCSVPAKRLSEFRSGGINSSKPLVNASNNKIFGFNTINHKDTAFMSSFSPKTKLEDDIEGKYVTKHAQFPNGGLAHVPENRQSSTSEKFQQSQKLEPSLFKSTPNSKPKVPVDKRFHRPYGKRRFVPAEDTKKLIELMLQPDVEVSNVLSPKSFHQKFHKRASPDMKPVLETRQCFAHIKQSKNKRNYVSDESCTKSTEFPSVNAYEPTSAIEYSKNSELTKDRTELSTKSNKFVQNNLGRNRFGRFRSLKTLGESNTTDEYGSLKTFQKPAPQNSFKNKLTMHQYENSSFCSPEVQKRQSVATNSHYASASVPAKVTLGEWDKRSPFSSPRESRFQTFARTFLKAKRSLILAEGHNEFADEMTETENRIPNQLEQRHNTSSQVSECFHTPSKNDWNNSSLNQESPSTIFSRLLLNTPTSAKVERTRRFEEHTQYIPQTTGHNENLGNKPRAFENSNHDFKNPMGYPQKYAQDSHSNQKSNICQLTSSKNACLKSQTDSRHSERIYGKKESERHSLMKKDSSKRDINSDRPKSINSRYESSRNMETFNDLKKVPSCNSSGSRRKALFQSTPMKRSVMFQLDSTVSTINNETLDEDFSDSEVMTISSSP